MADWHHRFTQQARWTLDLRDYLLPRIQFSSQDKILDIGCGTGALSGELAGRTRGTVFGGDIDFQRLKMAMRNSPAGVYFGGDGHVLPFSAATFNVSLCHFYLLWVNHPLGAIQEMARVTKPGGYVIALAEPDYGGRIDHPPPLDRIRSHQINALRQQGADPSMGRKIKGLFHRAGLKGITTGVFQGKWSPAAATEEDQLEWKILAEDLRLVLPEEEIQTFKHADQQARADGQRVVYLPTFYAWGKA